METKRKTDYLEASPVVQRYMGRLSPGGQRNALYNIHYFIEWVGLSPSKFSENDIDELVEYQKKANNGERYEILDLLIDWVNSKALRASSQKTRYNQIRGLFKANRAELPTDTISFKSDKPKVVGTLSPENVRDIVLSSNETYGAMYLCMFTAGMGQEEFIYWNTHGVEQLRTDLRSDPEYIKVQMIGRKANKNVKNYYTLISGDALEYLKRYISVKGLSKRAIFVNQFGDPITKKALYDYWLRKIKALGLFKKGEDLRVRSGVNPHEMRDLFRTQWEKSPGTGSVAEFLMGHTVDELGYNKAHRDVNWVYSEYRKALPLLNIMTGSRPYGQVDETEVEKLSMQLEEAKKGQNKRVSDLESTVKQLTAALTKVMEKLEENES